MFSPEDDERSFILYSLAYTYALNHSICHGEIVLFFILLFTTDSAWEILIWIVSVLLFVVSVHCVRTLPRPQLTFDPLALLEDRHAELILDKLLFFLLLITRYITRSLFRCSCNQYLSYLSLVINFVIHFSLPRFINMIIIFFFFQRRNSRFEFKWWYHRPLLRL